jgi:hypothetical protein
MNEPKRMAGIGTLIVGGTLFAVGIGTCWLSSTIQAPNHTSTGTSSSWLASSDAPATAAESLNTLVELPLPQPHFTIQRISVMGPVHASQFSWLKADALVQIEAVLGYRSVIKELVPGRLVEIREFERAELVLAKLELTSHSLQQAIDHAKRLGLILPGDPLTRVGSVLAAQTGAFVLRQLSDQWAQSWLEHDSTAAVGQLVSELGLAPDEAMQRALALPKALSGLRGRRFQLTFQAGEPPTVVPLDNQPLTTDLRRMLQRSSLLLDANYFRKRQQGRFHLPATELERYLWSSLLDDPTRTAQRLEPAGQVQVEFLATPVLRDGVALREFRLGGQIGFTLADRGSTPAAGRLTLAIDQASSFALLDEASGILRQIELRARGDAAGWLLGRLLGLQANRQLEGHADLTARQESVPVR